MHCKGCYGLMCWPRLEIVHFIISFIDWLTPLNAPYVSHVFVFRSNALLMATSFHAIWLSCRSSLKGRNMRSWVLQQSSITASMNHTLYQAQNNRKETLLSVHLLSFCKRKTTKSCFLATLLIQEMPRLVIQKFTESVKLICLLSVFQ